MLTYPLDCRWLRHFVVINGEMFLHGIFQVLDIAVSIFPRSGQLHLLLLLASHTVGRIRRRWPFPALTAGVVVVLFATFSLIEHFVS